LKIECRSPDDFTVEVIYDAKKLKALIPQWEGDEDVDVVGKRYEVFADRKLRYLRTIEYDTRTEAKKFELHSMMHPNEEEKNFRCEIWLITPEGNRKAGRFIAGLAEVMWIRPLLACRFGQKVKVRSNIESYESGGRVALSEALDAYYKPDNFLEALVQLYRNEAKFGQDVIQAILSQHVSYMASEVVNRSESEFDSSFNIEFPIPDSLIQALMGQQDLTAAKLKEEGGEKKDMPKMGWSQSRNVTIDRKGLQLCVSDRVNKELVLTRFFRVHRDPCRVETWDMLPSGMRLGGGRQALELRMKLLFLLSEAELTGEFESLKETKDDYMF